MFAAGAGINWVTILGVWSGCGFADVPARAVAGEEVASVAESFESNLVVVEASGLLDGIASPTDAKPMEILNSCLSELRPAAIKVEILVAV